MHAPIQDDIEDKLRSAKPIQSIVYLDLGMRKFDALPSFFNSLARMVKSLTGCACDHLPSISLAGRCNHIITYDMHHGADGVWDVVLEEHFETYAPGSFTVACCEFV